MDERFEVEKIFPKNHIHARRSNTACQHQNNDEIAQFVWKRSTDFALKHTVFGRQDPQIYSLSGDI